MSLKILIFVAFFILQSIAVGAELRSVIDLKNLIQSKQITALDQLIPALPLEMQKNLLLVYDSHALNSQLVTPNTPRIIFFNSDGSLVFSMTQNPGLDSIHAGRDRLEIISFEREKQIFEFREFVFDGINLPNLDLGQNVNPKTCLTCHGQNPRPIFNDYNSWPGFYGSFSQDGLSQIGTKEYNWLKKFLSESKTFPRYANLDLSNFKPVTKGIVYELSESEETPAVQLGRKFEYLMFSRLAKKIVQSQKYSQVKSILEFLGSDADHSCGSRSDRTKALYKELVLSISNATDPLQQILQKINSQINRDYQAKVENFNLFNEVETSYYDARGVFSIPYFLSVLGHDPYYPIDQIYFQNQLVFLESLFQFLDLNSSDISTNPTGITTGIFHIRAKFNGEENENYFWGLADAIKSIDGSFQKNIVNCSEASGRALDDLAKINRPDPNKGGVLFE